MPNRKQLIASAVFALLALLLHQRATSGMVPKAPDDPLVYVAIAAADLPAGKVIDEGMIRFTRTLGSLVLPGVKVASSQDKKALHLIGARLREPIAMGSPFSVAHLALPGDEGGFDLEPGHRAVPIAVDPGSEGIYVRPGHRVDVSCVGRDRGGSHEVSVVLQDVRILDAGGGHRQKGDETGPVRSALLDVRDEDVARLQLAQEHGKLRLAIRGIGDEGLLPVREPAPAPAAAPPALPAAPEIVVISPKTSARPR